MHDSGIIGWRWGRFALLAALIATGFSPPAVFGQGKQMQGGWCGAHGNFTSGYNCPRCSSGGSTAGTSGVSTQNQMALDAAGLVGTLLGEWLRGDPQKAARLQAEARQRSFELQQEAERRAVEDERRKRESYSRLRGMLKLENFDGDQGALVLKGVDTGSGNDLNLKLDDSNNSLGLKLGDEDLKPRGTRAVANTGPPETSSPHTDPMVVDLRNFQRAAYVATLPDVSPEAIIAAAQGDVAIIGLPPPDAAATLGGAGLQRFQEANNAFRQSHDDGQKAAEYFNRAQAQREIAGRELRNMKAELEQQLARETDTATLAQKHELMGRIFAAARAEHEAWVSAKIELDASNAKKTQAQIRLLNLLHPRISAPTTQGGSAADAQAAAFVHVTPERRQRIDRMLELARDLGWEESELTRLRTVTEKLSPDGDDVSGSEIRDAWREVLQRNGSEYSREAAAAAGIDLPGAGMQTKHEDCTIFALAHAAGLPYGVVAARASALLRHGTWRPTDQRTNPQHVIEAKGLNGDEVIMLAESFGQAELVPSERFVETLRQGTPILVDVVAPDGNPDNQHQVVLTKTFARGGDTWFELMDSNQGPLRRLYLNTKELNTLLVENGVAYRPEQGTVPVLLRMAEAN